MAVYFDDRILISGVRTPAKYFVALALETQQQWLLVAELSQDT